MCMQKKEEFISKYSSEGAVTQRLKETPGLYRQYERLDDHWKQRFMEFCMGKKTLPLTYDPFFKCIFNPDVHPEWLSRFLSSILGENVKVVRILPQEDTLLDGADLLIMDILVELEGGELTNVEIQKSPYLFQGERMSCYSSDLLLRQYSRVKGEKGKNFMYSDIKPVYTIVIYEKSQEVFHQVPGTYIHKGETVFDSGLKVELLQKYWLIALDVFKEISYAVDRSEQVAWLSLLSTEDAEEAEKMAEEYPWLGEIYREMDGYLHKPQEVLNMFSEALKILDHNTVQYMVDLQKEQIGKQQEQIGKQQEQLEQKDEQIHRQQEEITKYNINLISRVRKKYQRGKTVSEAVEELEEEVAVVQLIYDLIAEFPQKSDEEILLAQNDGN